MAVIDGKWHDTSCHNRLVVVIMVMIIIMMIMIVKIMIVMIKIIDGNHLLP